MLNSIQNFIEETKTGSIFLNLLYLLLLTFKILFYTKEDLAEIKVFPIH